RHTPGSGAPCDLPTAKRVFASRARRCPPRHVTDSTPDRAESRKALSIAILLAALRLRTHRLRRCSSVERGLDVRGRRLADDEPEAAIALELLLVEPLVAGALVRKRVVQPLVRADVHRIVVVHGRLEQDEASVARGIDPVAARIADGGPIGAARLRGPGDLALPLDLHAEVDADLPQRIAEVLELPAGITARIDDHDRPAPSLDHLVECQVLEVAAVGEIHVRILVVGEPERLREERTQREPRAVV